MLLLYGAGWAFTVELVGHLYYAEVVALIGMPFVSPRRTIAALPALRVIIFGYLIWMLGLLISDLVNNTPVEAAAKGQASLVCAIISLVFVTGAIARSLNNIVFLFLGLAFSLLVFGSGGYKLGGHEIDLAIEVVQENSNFFKVRFVPFLIPTMVLVAMLLNKKSGFLVPLIFTATGLAFVVLDARSSGLSLVIAGCIAGLSALRVKFTPKSIALIAAPTLVFAQLAFVFYVDYVIESQPDGQSARQLKNVDDSYNPLSLLAVGRADWLIAYDVISSNPIVGYGSWAYDKGFKYNRLLQERLNDSVFTPSASSRRSDQASIPAHSVLLMSWIWGGIMGFVGCVLIASKVASLGLDAVNTRHRFTPALTLLLVLFAWNLFFSPFQSIRISFPHTIAFLLVFHSVVSSRNDRGTPALPKLA